MARISGLQMFAVNTVFLYCTTAAFLIAPLSETVGYNSPLALCTGACAGMLAALFGPALGSKAPQTFFAEFGKEIVGRWLHYPLMVVIIAYLLQRAAMDLRYISDFLAINHLLYTPSEAITMLVGSAVVLTVRSGILSIVRLAQMAFFITLLLLVPLTPIMMGIEVQWQLAVAFLTRFNLPETGMGTLQAAPWFGDLFLLLLIYPHFKEGARIKSGLVWGTLTGLAFVLSYFIPTLLAFGPALTGHLNYPVLEFIRTLRIADFIETLDPILTILWIPIIFTKISLFVYAAVISLTKMMKLDDHKPFAFSVTAFAAGYSLFFVENSTELLHYSMVHWPFIALGIQSLPALYWIIAMLRRWKPSSG